EEDGVAGTGRRGRAPDRLLEPGDTLDRDAGRTERGRDLVPRGAEEERELHLAAGALHERRVSPALSEPAREQDNRPGERLEAPRRRACARRLRVVDEADAAALADERQAV